jgi:ABC-type nitrate/sulfonate/bicarbonate transport system substrate-binding protein
LFDLGKIALPASPFMCAEAFIQKRPQTVENFIKALIEASAIMRAQKERRNHPAKISQGGPAARRAGL